MTASRSLQHSLHTFVATQLLSLILPRENFQHSHHIKMLFQNTLLALLVGTAVVAFPGYPEKSTCSAGKFTYGKNADIDTLTIFKCTKRRRKSPRRRRHISRPRPSTSPSLPSAASSPRRLYPMPLQVLGLPPRYFSLPQHYQHSLTILDCHQVQDED